MDFLFEVPGSMPQLGKFLRWSKVTYKSYLVTHLLIVIGNLLLQIEC